MKKPNSVAMKTRSIINTLFFVLCFFSSYSQEQLVKLKLEEGHEYVFQTTDEKYSILEDNSKEISSVQGISKFRLFVEKFIPDQEAIISVNFLKNNYYDNPSFSNLINKTDLFYPDFTPDINIISSSSRLFRYVSLQVRD